MTAMSGRTWAIAGAGVLAAGLTALWLHFGLLADLTPAERSHVYERGVIHVFSAAAVAQLVRLALLGAERALLIRRVGGRLWYWIPVVLAPLAIYLREPGDVAAGAPLLKSWIDPCGWVVGLLLDRYATGLLAPRHGRANRDIRALRSQRRARARRRRK